MRYEQVAGTLNIPVGTVRSRRSRGRDALRHLMNIEDRRLSSAAEHHLEPTPLGLSSSAASKLFAFGRSAARECANSARGYVQAAVVRYRERLPAPSHW